MGGGSTAVICFVEVAIGGVDGVVLPSKTKSPECPQGLKPLKKGFLYVGPKGPTA
jgi:hypothetical protein